MRSLLEYNTAHNILENLEKAKKDLSKKLKASGYEIYIDDSKGNTLVISVDELVDGGKEYPDIQKHIDAISKKYKLKKDKMSNDEVVFLKESLNEESTVAISSKKFRSALKDIAKLLGNNPDKKDALLQTVKKFFQGNNYVIMEDDNWNELDTHASQKALADIFSVAKIFAEDKEIPAGASDEFKAVIEELSSIDAKVLDTIINSNITQVQESGENFMFSREPLNYPNFMHGVKGTNLMAKSELVKWWNMQGLSPDAQKRAIKNILKVQHSIYTNYYLGHPARQYVGDNNYKPSMTTDGKGRIVQND